MLIKLQLDIVNGNFVVTSQQMLEPISVSNHLLSALQA